MGLGFGFCWYLTADGWKLLFLLLVWNLNYFADWWSRTFPLCKGGLRGILSFKSLPTSLYKGRSKNPDNSFHILSFYMRLQVSSLIKPAAGRRRGLYETSIILPTDGRALSPLQRGISSFKSLPTSLYKGRSKKPDNSFHILSFCMKLQVSSLIKPAADRRRCLLLASEFWLFK